MSCRTCLSDCESREQVRAWLARDRRRYGVKTDQAEIVVALAGNPNTGKSTVFNHLTGLRQHTGNWPGKTVTRAEGRFTRGETRFRLVDLPGTYSLLSQSEDERIARDFLFFGQPDVTVVVADATALARNLGLVYQIFELHGDVVVCCNLMDEARRRGVEIDVACLSEELGVPVVPAVARRGDGMEALVDSVSAVARGERVCAPRRVTYPEALERALDEMTVKLRPLLPHLPNLRWVALRLLDGDEEMGAALADGRLERLERVARVVAEEEADTADTPGLTEAPEGA